MRADFGGILSAIPYEILPHEFVDEMETSSMKFTCCPEDESLVVSNYTDVTCSTSPDAQFRISADWNGQCSVIGNNEDMIAEENWDKITHYAENADDTYVFIMKWQCNEYEASCDDIVLISDELLPNTCSNEC